MSSDYSSPSMIRLVICIGRNCNPNAEAEPLFQELEATFDEPSDFRCTKTMRWERANCLD